MHRPERYQLKRTNHVHGIYLLIVHIEYVVATMPMNFQMLVSGALIYEEIRRNHFKKNFEIFWITGSEY